MELSIVIVNYNVKYFLEQCIYSILASDIDFTYEIIVVDNNSTDGSVGYLKTKFDQAHISIIANKDNIGFAKANNQAIRRATGKYVLLLNPDTVLGESVLPNIYRFMEENPDAGAVGVKTINGAGQFLPESKRGFPTPWVSFCKLTGLASVFPHSSIFGKYNLRYLSEDKTHKVPILVGAFMMIRKSALDKTGLLDETFFMYGEDIDLSYRISKAGYSNYYLPEKIIHYKGESTDRNDRKYIDAFYDAMRIFYKKHYPHYGKFFSAFISFGISIRSVMTYLSPKKNSSPKDVEIVVFDKNEMSYEDIIEKMDLCKKKNIQFRIYNPDSGITVGTQFAESK